MKITVHGPMAGIGPDGLNGWSWAPDEPVEVDDGDKQAVAWARRHLAGGTATLVEDVASKEPKAPARGPGSRA